MKLSDFDYELLPEAIAAEPARPRHAARLLDLEGVSINDRIVSGDTCTRHTMHSCDQHMLCVKPQRSPSKGR